MSGPGIIGLDVAYEQLGLSECLAEASLRDQSKISPASAYAPGFIYSCDSQPYGIQPHTTSQDDSAEGGLRIQQSCPSLCIPPLVISRSRSSARACPRLQR